MRRDFPCPGDGGARYPQRRSDFAVLAGTALLLAAVLIVFFAVAAVTA